LLLFGGKKLPTLAKDLGSGIKEFRKSLFSTEEPPSALPDNESVTIEKTKKQKKA
ncbi:MAG: twin-arginine translocase TatA/TatE family subunit, partial [Leptospiraceae bacterium]|nr:twin-arginine translocase TatA/TatE family subunit [Leptospiraceae bacterium]